MVKYLNKKEAMKYLGIKSYTTLQRYVINDNFPVYATPFGERYKTDDLDEYIKQYQA